MSVSSGTLNPATATPYHTQGRINHSAIYAMA